MQQVGGQRTEGHSFPAPYMKLEDCDTKEEENWGDHYLNTGK